MAESRIAIFCYWGGSMTQTTEGLSYDHQYQRVIKVNQKMTYDQLVNRLYCIVGMDKDQFRLKNLQ